MKRAPAWWRNQRRALLTGRVAAALLAVASVAVLVGGRMADQIRRVGLLKAVGGTPGLVAAVLLAEYVVVALLAAAAGLASDRWSLRCSPRRAPASSAAPAHARSASDRRPRDRGGARRGGQRDPRPRRPGGPHQHGPRARRRRPPPRRERG